MLGLARAAIVPAALLCLAAAGPDSDDGPAAVAGHAHDSVVDVVVEVSEANGSTPADSASGPQYVYDRRRLVVCGALDAPAFADTMCVAEAADVTVVRTCADGSTALNPLFRRPVDPATGRAFGVWEQVDNGGCPEDPPVTVILTLADFRRLPLAPSIPSTQPADGRGLVNMDLIVFTDPTPQTLTTTILGVPITVRATPVTYTWDFGDHTTPLTTTDPGHPYPNHTVARPYTHHGTYQLTLTTTWAGQYQINGTGPWHDVTGTATTTSTPLTTQIYEAHPHLVSGPEQP